MVHEVKAIQEHFYVPFPASEVSGKLSCSRHRGGGPPAPWHRGGGRSQRSCEVWLKPGCQSAVTDPLGTSSGRAPASSEPPVNHPPVSPRAEKGTRLFNFQNTLLNISPITCCSCLQVPVVRIVAHPPLLTELSCCRPGVKPLQGWIRDP